MSEHSCLKICYSEVSSLEFAELSDCMVFHKDPQGFSGTPIYQLQKFSTPRQISLLSIRKFEAGYGASPEAANRLLGQL
jgi:hypothetical protein